MTVKARIAFGIAALLLVVVLLGGMAVWFLSRIETSVEVAAGAVYDRLDLAQSLSFEAASLHGRPPGDAPVNEANGSLGGRRARFAERLLANAAALFERPATSVDRLVIADLESDANKLLELDGTGTDPTREAQTALVLGEITRLLKGVYEDNAVQLEREIQLASDRADRGYRYIGILMALCVAFSVAVLIWLPQYVARPIRDFAKSLTRITAGNYKTRLPVERSDEFGRLASTFNLMAAELEAGSTESQAAVLESQVRLSSLVDQLDDLMLGMDAGRVIVFINAAMARYLGVDPDEVLGQYMPDLALGRPRVQQLFRPIALGKASAIEPFEIEETDGTSRYLQ